MRNIRQLFKDIKVGCERDHVIIGQKIFEDKLVVQSETLLVVLEKIFDLITLEKTITEHQKQYNPFTVNKQYPEFKDLHEEDHDGVCLDQDFYYLDQEESFEKNI